VLAEKIPACQFVKHACRRQKADLQQIDDKYRFDVAKANRICAFVELLEHIKGEWAGHKITLQPWQIFILTTVFGWVDRDGYRRFKTAYTEIPRKNAKSTLSSAIALYLLGMDGEGGAEVYSAATTRDQARIVFQDAKLMAQRSDGLKKRGYQTSAHAIYQESTASTMKALARDQGGNLDGLNVHAAIIDELHAHKIRDVWDVIETATGARRQPLIWAITTAGFNRAGICYEQRAYLIKILTGVVKDDEYFGIIYTVDEADDWADETSWMKANPNWGVSVSSDDIRRKARKALEMSAAQNNFLTKHLNIWCNADTAWMNMRYWDACKRDICLEDFIGCKAWLGVDLASKTDLACIGIIIERDGLYYAFVHSFLNEDAVEDGRNSQYSGWARDELITTTPGNVTDFGMIEDEIRRLCTVLDVQEAIFDQWQAQSTMQRLTADGLPVVEYRQTVQNMSEPMKTLEAWVLQEKLLHSGDPHLAWMISNVVCHVDAKDNIYPRKDLADNKIDGAVALIMAIGRAMLVKDEQHVGLELW
jgi:phage terminase large subunit-like protein